jgi:cell division protein FtsW (lipid II flippase)
MLIHTGQYAFLANISDPTHTFASNIIHYAQFVGPATGSNWTVVSSRTGFLITSIIGAYGWLAGVGVAIVSCVMCVLMLRRSLHIAHSYGRLLATGISAYFTVRFIMYFLANMGLIDGYFSLPFISFGILEYFVDAVLVGIFLSIWRRSTFMKDDVKRVSAMPKYSAVQ